MKSTLQLSDLVAIPFTIIVISLIGYYKSKKYTGTDYKKFFYPAFFTKVFLGTTLHFLYHRFIYRGGDTFQYYKVTRQFLDSFLVAPFSTFASLFQSPSSYAYIIFQKIPHHYYYLPEEGLAIKLSSFFSLLSFGSFLGTGFWLSLITFGGLWRLYRVAIDIYPHLIKPLAFGILFFPSVVFWASSISKDAITLGALGFIIYDLYIFFIKKKVSAKRVISFLFFTYILSIIKGYIVILLFPGLALWIFFTYKNNIRHKLLKKIATPFLLLFLAGSLVVIVQALRNSPTFQEFTSPEVLDRAVVIYEYLNDAKRANSTYSFGNIEPTILGFMKVFPAAVNVSLFRPYLWEIKNLPMALAAMESFFTLLITLLVIFKRGIIPSFRRIANDPFLIFCLFFVVSFAGVVGITSGNFGTLMRYKIPLIPFYSILLFVLYAPNSDKKSLVTPNTE